MDDKEAKDWITRAMKEKAEAFLASAEGQEYMIDVYAGVGTLRTKADGTIERVKPEDFLEAPSPVSTNGGE